MIVKLLQFLFIYFAFLFVRGLIRGYIQNKRAEQEISNRASNPAHDDIIDAEFREIHRE
jgi:hypothetical protein